MRESAILRPCSPSADAAETLDSLVMKQVEAHAGKDAVIDAESGEALSYEALAGEPRLTA